MQPFAERSQRVSTSAASRLFASMWRQRTLTPECPTIPRLDGSLALVTGGTRGIGLPTSLGLAERGAEVISASRADPARGLPLTSLPLDLSDLDSVAHLLDALGTLLAGRRIDRVVANAGIWPSRHRTSAQGFEIAFATNVLGHFALVEGLLRRELLAEGARVVVVTGDIYILADACTPDFRYQGIAGCQQAYCRSKLGNLWMVREWSRRRPALQVNAVHPGVVASDLSGGSGGAVGLAKRALLLSPRAGAQTSLFCATQPGVAPGAYYHNTQGRMELPSDDPALDDAGSAALFDLLEELAAGRES